MTSGAPSSVPRAAGILVSLIVALASVAGAQPADAQGAGGAIRYTVVADGSEARYRVREQLASLSFPNDAVGATSAVEGRIAFDARGRVLAGESRFTVDLRALASDEARRDNYVRRRTLETDRYPVIVFVPTEARGLPFPFPPSGEVPFELVGELTLRETTRPIIWRATATFDGDRVTVTAQTAFRFGDFGLPIPRVAVVLSVEDLIRLETDLVLRRGS